MTEKATTGLPNESVHYQLVVQPIEVMINLMTPEEFKGFLKGNMIKYSMRAGRKAGESAEKDKNKFSVYSMWLSQFNENGCINCNGKAVRKIKSLPSI